MAKIENHNLNTKKRRNINNSLLLSKTMIDTDKSKINSNMSR